MGDIGKGGDKVRTGGKRRSETSQEFFGFPEIFYSFF
jgi:hypothetical protein